MRWWLQFTFCQISFLYFTIKFSLYRIRKQSSTGYNKVRPCVYWQEFRTPVHSYQYIPVHFWHVSKGLKCVDSRKFRKFLYNFQHFRSNFGHFWSNLCHFECFWFIDLSSGICQKCQNGIFLTGIIDFWKLH